MRASTCKHFNGIQNDVCEKGVGYDKFRDGVLDDLRARLDALKSIRPGDIIEGMTECPDDDGFYSVDVEEVWWSSRWWG